MFGVIVGIFVFVLFLEIIMLISWIDMKRKRKAFIRGKFGRTPKAKEWDDNIRGFYDVVSDGSGVDDVTWNDLSMNDVFRRISQCDTSVGEEVLYWKLRRKHMSQEERQLFERRVRMFMNNQKEREEIEELLCDIGKSPSSYYIPSYLDSMDIYLLKHAWVYRALQILLVMSAVILLIFQTDAAAMPLAATAVVNLVIYTTVKMRNETGLYMVGAAAGLIKNGKKLAKRKEIQIFFPELEKAVSKLGGVTRAAWILQFQQAGRESGELLSTLADYIGGITLWQVTTYNKVMRRLKAKEKEYFEVYRCIGEMDAAVSTASLRKNLPWYCLPEYTGEKKVEMEELYHPLIEDPVANSVTITKNCLITGSNASGKSTFIKAVAVNAILAQSINTCAARAFILPECSVITSMAVKDDLMAGESYFIREIKYLRRILDSLNEDKMTLCAIDEILRGTNTGERIRASRAILEYLSDKNCIALVATHDKELTELLGDSYANYHFSEEIGEHDIVFNYRIIEGPASSQNAVKLLEFAGFPKEIIRASCR